MNHDEAVAWLSGQRSSINIVINEPFETWEVRIAQTDAAMMQQAYWVLRAHEENLLKVVAEF